MVSSEKAQIAESTLIFSLVGVASFVPQFFLLSDKAFWAVVAFKFSICRLACIVLAVFLDLSQSTGIHCPAVRRRCPRGTFWRSYEPLRRATATFGSQIQLLEVRAKRVGNARVGSCFGRNAASQHCCLAHSVVFHVVVCYIDFFFFRLFGHVTLAFVG